LPFSQPSEWSGLETEYQLLLVLRHGESLGGQIISLWNLTEIQEGHEKDDNDKQ
jgi:hypothetical protein